MKQTEYYKSGKHLQNVLIAREKANQQSQINKQKRIDNYNLCPTVCRYCNSSFEYNFRKNKFCNASCSAKYNNARKDYTIIKTGPKIGTKHKVKRSSPRININGFCKIQWNTCGACGKLFYTKTWSNPRKSCGAIECKTHLSVGNRTYKNGRRKIFYYFNKHQNKEVMLESTWEYNLAKWLDENNIIWIRPSYIKWYDGNKQKYRLYYPDFYLPDINLYLDPKNPTSLKLDSYKMSQVEKLIPIVYGDVESIKQSILSGYKDFNLGPPGPKPGALN